MSKRIKIKEFRPRKKRATTLEDYQRKLHYLRVYEIVPFKSWKKISAQQKRWITINHRRVAQMSIDHLSEFIPIKNHHELKRLREAGMRGTRKGVVIPKIIESYGVPMKNQKITVTDGSTKTRVGNRTDYDFYFDKKTRKQIAVTPDVIHDISKDHLKSLNLKKNTKTRLTIIYRGGLNRLDHATARNWEINDSDRRNAKYIIGVRISTWAKAAKKKARRKKNSKR